MVGQKARSPKSCSTKNLDPSRTVQSAIRTSRGLLQGVIEESRTAFRAEPIETICYESRRNNDITTAPQGGAREREASSCCYFKSRTSDHDLTKGAMRMYKGNLNHDLRHKSCG